MKTRTFLGFTMVAVAFATCLLPQPTLGQAGADDPLLGPLLDDMGKQQASLVENQTKIDEKLAIIAEDMRVARIFVSRGGGKVK